MTVGGVSFDEVKNKTKKVAKKVGKVAKKTLDVVAPIGLDVGFDLGQKALSVPLTAALLATPGLEPLAVAAPLSTKIASKVARRGVKKLTGYGADVGMYAGKTIHKQDKRKLRCQAMKELIAKGMTFKEASKHATKYTNENLL